ncbi:MAG: Crp/Fnr family transcriptional regulator [Thermoflexibacter sp.]|jgi:CRP-like cAMP-binding protein|nr:Crp/Fnr family transcriptional regulator [Thermoflexibacter sp.]
MSLHDFINTFWEVKAEITEELVSKSISKSYQKGEIITSEGQLQRELLWVETGVQMSYFSHEGNIHVIAFTYAPSLSGIPESFLFQKPSRYYLEALTNSSFKAIPYPLLQDFFDKSPPLERAFRKITEHILAGMVNRHLELQTLTIEQRFRFFAQRSPHLFQLVPHKYIANYLHINPTNFSKLYNSIKI